MSAITTRRVISTPSRPIEDYKVSLSASLRIRYLQIWCKRKKASVMNVVMYGLIIRLGFYDDINMLPCDTYLGICVHLLSYIGSIMVLISYCYLFHRLVRLAEVELFASRWIEPVNNLKEKLGMEEALYKV